MKKPDLLILMNQPGVLAAMEGLVNAMYDGIREDARREAEAMERAMAETPVPGSQIKMDYSSGQPIPMPIVEISPPDPTLPVFIY